MSTTARILILTGGMLIAAAAKAQPGGGLTETYNIVGTAARTINNVQKIDMRPAAIDTVLPDTPMRYELLPLKAEVAPRADSIEAYKLNIRLTQERLYKGFVKAGFGLYTTPLFDVYYDQARNRKNGYGLHYRHMSSNGGLADVGPSDYSFNRIDGHYSAYLRHHELTGRLGYDRRRISYYGYPFTDSLNNLQLVSPAAPDDLVKQVYNDLGFSVRLKSLFDDSTKLAHDVTLATNVYKNLTGSSETNVRLSADVAMAMGQETYGARLVIDNNAYRRENAPTSALARVNGTMIGLEPYVSTGTKAYHVKVGAGLYLDAQNKTTFHFYPQAYADYHLMYEALVIYAGADGRRIRNNFRSLTQANPWLDGSPAIANSSLLYDLYGGLRASLGKDVGFDVRVSKSSTKDRPLFVSAPQELRIDSTRAVRYGDRFFTVYDQVGQLDISGQLTYSRNEHLDITGRIDIFTYGTDLQAEAWNLPPYQLSLGGRYDLRDKLILKVEAQFLGQRKAGAYTLAGDPERSATAVPVVTRDLDGFLDLYLGVEYRYTKRLSLWLDASNLSASKYERWYNHTVQRGLVMGGATFAF
jgi:hypothetical protein